MASKAAIDLVIGLVDKASGPLKVLTGSLSTLGKIGGGALLGGAVAGVGALSAALVGGIADAREANQVMAATENVIRSMGRTGKISADQIAEMAGSLSATEGKSLFGDSEIQAGQNMLLTFANINEVLPDATQAMVDMTQFMGGDMVGASTMLGKALDNPTQGLSALSRVGVSFSEQQKEQIKTMQEAGNMAGAQGVILDALKSQFGGAALAAAQADGGFAQFKDRMGELAESVGARVLPALNSLMGWLNSPEVQGGITAIVDGLTTGVTTIATAISAVVTAFQSGGLAGVFDLTLPKLQEFGTSILTWITEQAPIWATQLAAWGEQFIAWVSPYIQPMLDKLGELVTSTWNWVSEQAPILLEKLGAWGVQLGAWILPQIPVLLENLGKVIGNIVVWIGEQMPAIKASVKQWGEGLVKWIEEVAIPGLSPAFAKFDTEMGRLMDDLMKKAGDAGEATGTEISARLSTAMSEGLPHFRDVTLNEWSESIFTWLNETAPKIIPGAKMLGQTIIDAIKEKQAEWLPTLDLWATDIFTWANDTGAKVGAWVKQVGTNMILGMINGVREQAASLATAAAKVVLDAIQAAKDAILSHSPSRLTEKELGEPIVDGIIKGVEGRASPLTHALKTAVLDPVVALAKGLKVPVDEATAHLGKLIGAVEKGAKIPADEATARLNKIVGAYEDAGKRLKVPVDEATAHLDKLVSAAKNTATDMDLIAPTVMKPLTTAVDASTARLRISSEELQRRVDTLAGSADDLADRLKMPVGDIQSRLDGLAGTADSVADRLGLTAPTMMHPLTNALALVPGQIDTQGGLILGGMNRLVDEYNRVVGRIQQPEFFGGYAGTPTPITTTVTPRPPVPVPGEFVKWSSGSSAMQTSQPITIMVDARGATNPEEVEAAGYRGAQRALKEAGTLRGDLRSEGVF